MRHIAQRVTLLLLRAYKWAISPMLPPACRYVPTCSEYAVEAVERYGALHGGLMALARLLRCHPFAKGGYDPVVRMKHEIHASNHHAAQLTVEQRRFSAASSTGSLSGFSPSLKRNA